MKVAIYWNSRKKLFSVRSEETRKVIAHVPEFVLLTAELKVSEAGRQRVLRTKKKNVHAVIRGELFYQEVKSSHILTHRRVSYNPYTVSSFTDRETGQAVLTARSVIGTTCNGRPTIRYR